MPDLRRDSATAAPPLAPAIGSHRLHEPKPKPSRVGIAWAALVVGLLAMVALIVFVSQNTHIVQVRFLWLRASMPLASALLTAVVGTAVVAATIGAVRSGQLRHRNRRGRVNGQR